MKRRSWLLLVGLLVLVGFSSAPVLRAEKLTLEQRDKDIRGVAVLADGEVFAEYQISLGPKPIVWPIIGPTGKEMTRRYPMQYAVGEEHDHPHHRSLWFTHMEVNGVDFWSEKPGGHGRTVHRQYTRLEAKDNTAVIGTINDWIAPDGGKVLEDERTLTFRADGDVRTIDFDILLKATEGPVTLGDNKDGVFGIRIPSSMDVKRGTGGKIINSEGQTDEAAWGKPARWVDYYGPVEDQTLGIAILNHPSSFRYPTTWHVRTYGLFAANPFGLHDFTKASDVDGSYTMAAGETLRFRYRVLFHLGDEKQGQVAEAFEAFSKEP